MTVEAGRSVYVQRIWSRDVGEELRTRAVCKCVQCGLNCSYSCSTLDPDSKRCDNCFVTHVRLCLAALDQHFGYFGGPWRSTCRVEKLPLGKDQPPKKYVFVRRYYRVDKITKCYRLSEVCGRYGCISR